ncbi:MULTISPECIES: SDR family NAD(P)-dependent oxidoreductase [Mycolicibacterium]|uniref:Short-chain dehydrogenase n=1 Tax=Mycolicibacterium senegalense TaxID=1796 RepID=A0A378W7U5_9MYCO|nr:MULTISPECIES: SDR family oxidoreductase [Mycolicibacterium]MCV7333614.1 SDR family oxidoreductase [Mycolicibacterium senegalense]MDR7288086.1 NAD(P)-dependent dehydrogenase (short-subunit alcohol dehydrogenase family) [Mycolicibacterium senegalense]QZA25070.1 SDR family oxidoreductase [Mycolicibacterium senegalense]CDP86114.1 short-chain dehydrogenase/reductase SDR [Mycolicibacterium farcinogenes]SUA28338.1 short-chain dehydrogenase [Mycolicibacterium senegalense]
MGQLDGKTALVTGGTSGIGLATARRLAAEGAYVFITGRDRARLDEAAASIGAHGIQSDISKIEDLDTLAEEIGMHGKGLDVVFANAGGGDFATLAEVTPEHYRDNFDRNVAGTVFTVQKVLPLLNEGASIVLAGSTAASEGVAAFGLYAASKAAIRSLGRTWAAELADRKIRVNTVVPGPIETPGLTGLAPADQKQDLLDGMASQVPMKRLGRPEEVASAVLFLASDQSSFMTGAVLAVDGGQIQL